MMGPLWLVGSGTEYRVCNTQFVRRERPDHLSSHGSTDSGSGSPRFREQTPAWRPRMETVWGPISDPVDPVDPVVAMA